MLCEVAPTTARVPGDGVVARLIAVQSMGLLPSQAGGWVVRLSAPPL